MNDCAAVHEQFNVSCLVPVPEYFEDWSTFRETGLWSLSHLWLPFFLMYFMQRPGLVLTLVVINDIAEPWATALMWRNCNPWWPSLIREFDSLNNAVDLLAGLIGVGVAVLVAWAARTHETPLAKQLRDWRWGLCCTLPDDRNKGSLHLASATLHIVTVVAYVPVYFFAQYVRGGLDALNTGLDEPDRGWFRTDVVVQMSVTFGIVALTAAIDRLFIQRVLYPVEEPATPPWFYRTLAAVYAVVMLPFVYISTWSPVLVAISSLLLALATGGIWVVRRVVTTQRPPQYALLANGTTAQFNVVAASYRLPRTSMREHVQ